MSRQAILSPQSVYLTALLCLIQVVLILCPSSSHTAWAAASEQPAKPSHKSKTKGTPASLRPATVQNIRLFSTADRTRLVLDLDRQPHVREHRSASADDIILALPNVTMSSTAKRRLDHAVVTAPFLVSQESATAVTVSFPAAMVRQYKHFTLANPPRLVVDVTPAASPSPPPAPMLVAADARDAVAPVPEIPPQPAAPAAKPYKIIVLDPGHGGKDPGARGQHGTEEKDITLKVALLLRDLLSRQPGVRVLMTREHDVFVELEDRAKYANGQNADLFISIHVNSHPSRAVKGIEIYHFGQAKDQRALEVAARENGTPLDSTDAGVNYILADLLTGKKIEESLELAWTAKESMVAHMNGHYDVNDHGVKTAPFYVLRYTSMPSILAEIAYISNPSEETLLRKNTFIHDVAESLLSGVKTFLNSGRLAAR